MITLNILYFINFLILQWSQTQTVNHSSLCIDKVPPWGETARSDGRSKRCRCRRRQYPRRRRRAASFRRVAFRRRRCRARGGAAPGPGVASEPRPASPRPACVTTTGSCRGSRGCIGAAAYPTVCGFLADEQKHVNARRALRIWRRT